MVRTAWKNRTWGSILALQHFLQFIDSWPRGRVSPHRFMRRPQGLRKIQEPAADGFADSCGEVADVEFVEAALDVFGH